MALFLARVIKWSLPTLFCTECKELRCKCQCNTTVGIVGREFSALRSGCCAQWGKAPSKSRTRRCVDAGVGPNVVAIQSPGHSALSQRDCRNCHNVSVSQSVRTHSVFDGIRTGHQANRNPSHQTAWCQAVLPEGQPARFITQNTHANKCESKFSYLRACKQI
jgi:hypothetical protein